MTTASTQTWGSAAFGSCGKISVEVDDRLSGPERWQLTVTCPTWYFRFDISGVQAVAEWLAFLQEHYGATQGAERSIGTFLRRKVWIIKDDEFPDRFFLNVRSAQMVSFTIIDPEVQDLIEALSRALKDVEGLSISAEMERQPVRRDASLAVKIWIVASVLFMFGAIAVRDLDRRALMRSIGELSLAVSVMVGFRQCQSRDSGRPF